MDEIKDLIERIKTALQGNDEEVSIIAHSRGNSNYFSIQRKPSGDPQFYANESGEIIFDWKEKFIREKEQVFPPFKNGEQILVNGFVEPDPEGAYKIHVDADGRIADNFFINASRPDSLQEYTGMCLEMILKVGAERKERYMISDIWNYDADIVKITSTPIINPSSEQIAELEKGKRVIVNGTFVGFDESSQDKFLQSLGYAKGACIAGEHSHIAPGIWETELSILAIDGKKTRIQIKNPPKGYHDRATSGIVMTPEGRAIRISMPTGRIVFNGGSLENIATGYESPLEGDEVKIAAFVTGTKNLAAQWCDPCYLGIPSEVRQKNYDTLRASALKNIQAITTHIEKREYAQARTIIGDTRSLELTRFELESIRKITDTIPESERPVQPLLTEYNRFGSRTFNEKSIDEAYNTKLGSMTVSQFIEFTRRATMGDIEQTGKDADTSYLFSIAEDFGIDKTSQENIILDCLETRLPKIDGKEYHHDTDFDNKYLVETALIYLASLGTRSSSEKSFDYIRRFMENGSYKELGWRKKSVQKEDFLFSSIEAITRNIHRMNHNVLMKELPYMRDLRVFLAKKADEPVTIDELDRVINYLEEKIVSN